MRGETVWGDETVPTWHAPAGGLSVKGVELLEMEL